MIDTTVTAGKMNCSSRVWVKLAGCLAILAIGTGSVWDSNRFILRGRWVLMRDGEPAPSDLFQRGLQTSGLAWDGKLLWSVGDQRSTYAGQMFALDPATGRLDRDPVPLVASSDAIQLRLDAWQRLDLEDIAVLSAADRRFVIVLEDKAIAALVVQLDEQEVTGTVTAVWEFQFPSDQVPRPFRNDPNYRLEGIAIDEVESRGYVAFERDERRQPQLYQFPVPPSAHGICSVALEPVPFKHWDQLQGKHGSLVNVNGLHFFRTNAAEPRLVLLCRDRELFVTIDPDSGNLIEQFPLSLLSPQGEAIEWASPEGIALNTANNVVYIINDPDSTDGNYRLQSTPAATGRFARFVPLLFELRLTARLR